MDTLLVGSGFGQISEAAIGPAERERHDGCAFRETLQRDRLPCFKLVAHALLAAHRIIGKPVAALSVSLGKGASSWI